MAPRSIPQQSFPSRSFPGQNAAASITISDDDSGSSGVRSVVDVSSDDSDDEDTSHWGLENEREVLATIIDLREVNEGVIPPTWEILEELRANGAFRRSGLTVRNLRKKICTLEFKFATSAMKAAGNGGKLRRRTKHRDKVLYEESEDVWPDMLEDGGYSYLEARTPLSAN